MKYTKEQLEGMSDLELSVAISKSHNPSHHNDRESYVIVKKHSRVSIFHSDDGFPHGLISSFDINNWADMGPVIKTNKIDVSYGKATPLNMASNGDLYVRDSNELRAAAIIYLLMQGGE